MNSAASVVAHERQIKQEAGAAPRFSVLGVGVNAIQIPKVIAEMQSWIEKRCGSHYIAVTGMHGISESTRDPEFARVLNAANLVVPDGMPLVWLGRLHGHELRRRVYGPELMVRFWRDLAANHYRHFFYGGKNGVAEELAHILVARFPGNQIAGTYEPPFRPLDENEEQELCKEITAARPDILWVGLSTPKQERWMFDHLRLQVPVLVGVGAAFDIISGRTPQAPRWMREHGLEWLFRLMTEPRRLWRRYVLGGFRFIFFLGLEAAGLKKFK
jgi:N-acetylglucosaminyldiphosphoundecaprenol N-acetyl-beta-D-mannosaminyltransferase